jgi:methionyl-tRNA synthetase
MEDFEFHKALMAVWELIGQMNKSIDVSAPWILAKQPSSRRQLEAVIYNLLEGLRIISGMVYPVMPDTAAVMQKHLGLDPKKPFYRIDALRKWRSLPPGNRLPKSVTLFPRVDSKQTDAGASKRGDHHPLPLSPPLKPAITIDDVAKLDLRVGRIISAEPVPKAKKLLKLHLDIGEERIVVSGIAGAYEPEDLVGRQIILVANLKPATIMGVESNGMILAAADGKTVTIATLEKPVAPGVPVS